MVFGEGLGTLVAAETLKLTAFLKCRYQNQEHSVEVPVDPGAAYGTADHQVLKARFHELYEREYTYRLDAPVEIVGLHLVAAAEVGKLKLAEAPVSGAMLADAIKGRRPVIAVMPRPGASQSCTASERPRTSSPQQRFDGLGAASD